MSAEMTAPRLGVMSAVRPIPLIAVSLGVAILLALGVWQVQRLAWKQDLLARIDALQNAPAEPLAVVLNRLPRDGEAGLGQVNYVRVQTACATLQQTPSLHLYAILNGVMGYRVITACPLSAGPYRSVLVDRGFMPGERAGQTPSGPAVAAPVIGVLRASERTSWLSPPNDVAHNDWHSRDLSAMALALHAPGPAPVFLMLESPRPAVAVGPTPAAIPADIPNNHLGYALTWFGLAAGLVATYVASLLRSPRSR